MSWTNIEIGGLIFDAEIEYEEGYAGSWDEPSYPSVLTIVSLKREGVDWMDLINPSVIQEHEAELKEAYDND